MKKVLFCVVLAVCVLLSASTCAESENATQKVKYGGFTVYIPDYFERYDTGTYFYMEKGKVAESVSFASYEYYESDLFADKDEALQYLDDLLAEGLPFKDRGDKEISIIEADECLAIKLNLPEMDQQSKDFYYIANQHERLVMLVTATGKNCEETVQRLSDDIIDNIEAPFNPY